MAKIAYVRVSTVEQNEGRQLEALKNLNIEKIFSEKVSGKNTDRPQLKAMLEYMREGDTVYIHDFSRIARSTEDLLALITQFENKGVHLISLKENLDTQTASGKLLVTMIAAINEFERANMLERQREGIALAVKEGKFKGRKKIDKPKQWDEVYQAYKNRSISANEAMETLNLKRTTFYKLIAEEKGETNPQ